MQGKGIEHLFVHYCWFRESSSCTWRNRGFFRAVFTGIGFTSLFPSFYVSPSSVFDLCSLLQLLWLHLPVVLCGVFTLFLSLQVYQFVYPKATKYPESRDPTQYFCQAVYSPNLSLSTRLRLLPAVLKYRASLAVRSLTGLWPVCVVRSSVHLPATSLCCHTLCPFCPPVHLFTLLDSGHCSPSSAHLSLVFCHGLVTPSLYLSSSPCSSLFRHFSSGSTSSGLIRVGMETLLYRPLHLLGVFHGLSRLLLLLCLGITASSSWSSSLVCSCSTLSRSCSSSSHTRFRLERVGCSRSILSMVLAVLSSVCNM